MTGSFSFWTSESDLADSAPQSLGQMSPQLSKTQPPVSLFKSLFPLADPFILSSISHAPRTNPTQTLPLWEVNLLFSMNSNGSALGMAVSWRGHDVRTTEGQQENDLAADSQVKCLFLSCLVWLMHHIHSSVNYEVASGVMKVNFFDIRNFVCSQTFPRLFSIKVSLSQRWVKDRNCADIGSFLNMVRKANS